MVVEFIEFVYQFTMKDQTLATRHYKG